MARCTSCGRQAGFLSEICDICKGKRLTPEQRNAAKPKLSSISLVREAATQIYRHRVALSLAVILPILCSQSLRMACIAWVCTGDEPPSMAVLYLVWLARLPFYVMFATICHRIVLLGGDALPNRWGIFWSVRETKFLVWLFVLAAIACVVYLPLNYALLVLPLELMPDLDFTWYLKWWWPVVLLICLIPTTYVDGRFGLMLPATAIGNPTNPLESWRATSGNSLAILLALLIPILVIDLIDYLLFGLLLDIESLVITFLRGLLYYPLFAIGIVIVTIAYRDLVLGHHNEAASDDARADEPIST